MITEELRFINNLAVVMDIGRPLLDSLQNLRESCTDRVHHPGYDAMIEAAATGADFTAPLTDFPNLCSRSALALLKAGRRTGCLGVLLPRLARLVRATAEGEWDPRRRFFETWALMVESGIPIAEGLSELSHDFQRGPLGEVAEGLRTSAASGRSLAEAAERFPEVFDAMSRDLLRYGEGRDLARALRGITQLL